MRVRSRPLPALIRLTTLLCTLVIMHFGTAAAQVTRPPPAIVWSSAYYIPRLFSPASRDGLEAAEQLVALCEADDPKVKTVLYEYIEAARRYCRKLDRIYFEEDIFGRFCIINETHVPNILFCDPEGDGQVNFNPDRSLALDCTKLKEFVADTFSRAWMDERLILLEPRWNASLCLKQIGADCAPPPAPLAWWNATALDDQIMN